MIASDTQKHDGLIAQSWQRCADKYHLDPSAKKPILRLRVAESSPRAEAFDESVADGRLEIRDLQELVLNAGHSLAISDSEMIIVDVHCAPNQRGDLEQVGISQGSIWNERLAGTNGIQMAYAANAPVTVRGKDHFYQCLTPFVCTSAPILDAENATIGVLTMSSLDRYTEADYVFARHFLTEATNRLQARLFKRSFREQLVLSVHRADQPIAQWRNALISVDDDGLIVGATHRAAQAQGFRSANDLIGKSAETLLETRLDRLTHAPERLVSLPSSDRPLMGRKTAHLRAQPPMPKNHAPSKRLAPELSAYCLGSEKMSALALKAQTLFAKSAPLFLDGETGVGKTELAKTLHSATGTPMARFYHLNGNQSLSRPGNDLKSILAKLSAPKARAKKPQTADAATLLLSRADLLSHAEQDQILQFLAQQADASEAGQTPVRLIATAGGKGAHAIRPELYYRLRQGYLTLLPVRTRDHFETLAQKLSNRIAKQQIEIMPDAMKLLREHPWNGNMRELDAVLSQAIMCGNGQTIFKHDLPDDLHMAKPAKSAESVRKPRLDEEDEQNQIRDMLIGTNWNVSKAARQLGIGRATINRKIARYGLSRSDLPKK